MSRELNEAPFLPSAEEEVDRILRSVNGNVIIGRMIVESRKVELFYDQLNRNGEAAEIKEFSAGQLAVEGLSKTRCERQNAIAPN